MEPLMTFAKYLDPDEDPKNMGPYLRFKYLTRRLYISANRGKIWYFASKTKI